jgi:hypothetical protein
MTCDLLICYFYPFLMLIIKHTPPPCLKNHRVEKKLDLADFDFFTEFQMNISYFCRNSTDVCVNNTDFWKISHHQIRWISVNSIDFLNPALPLCIQFHTYVILDINRALPTLTEKKYLPNDFWILDMVFPSSQKLLKIHMYHHFLCISYS